MTTPEAAQVAADTNLVRHSTPRRYLTVLEDLRGCRIAILPTVAHELRGHIPLQAAAYVRGICERDGKWTGSQIQTAARASAGAAVGGLAVPQRLDLRAYPGSWNFALQPDSRLPSR